MAVLFCLTKVAKKKTTMQKKCKGAAAQIT